MIYYEASSQVALQFVYLKHKNQKQRHQCSTLGSTREQKIAAILDVDYWFGIQKLMF